MTQRCACLLVAGLLAACGDAPAPRGVAITDVTVIDAVNGVREQRTVVFDGDEILAVAGPGEAIPEPARTIDGSGKYLVPGLWDMHVHLTYDDAFTPSMPARFLYYGITSVRDTGGLMAKLEPVVAAMRAPDAHAPRVFFSGPLLDGDLVVYDGESRPHIGISNPDPAAARENVAALDAAGVDFIKIYELVEPAVFEALVDAAGERRLPIAAHVPLALTALSAGPAVDSIEHLRNLEIGCAGNAAALYEARRAYMAEYEGGSGYELRSELHSRHRVPAIGNYDPAQCEQVLAALAGTVQVPTLRLNALGLVSPFDRDGWDEALRLVPDARRAGWGEAAAAYRAGPPASDTTFAGWSLRLVGDMDRAGVPLGAGTDTPIGYAIPGYSLHSELEMLVRAGLTPLEALAAATVQPARFFGLEQDMGTIQPGLRADLLLLDADPLADIANTRRISRVIHRGRVMDRSELAAKLADAVRQP
ncbi:MAG: amidohydrolase family protein [Woeseiaceae bacterium]|nr:amidohydrolase family protein [Woeseiaceae bacterium]